jgi:hypothetical protein
MANRTASYHKYAVGQTVGYSPSRWSMRGGDGSCKIVRLLPADAGENLYRIKCPSEPFERMAKESELTAPLDG